MSGSKKKILASAVISELKSSDKHLTIRGKLCDTKTNLNGVRVTEAFIDEIVANADDYSGTPLCADVRGLLNNRKIGHMYNQATGEFMSSIIGSMLSFERVDGSNGVVSLVFTARVMKRYKKICNALEQLYNDGKLKFSFEVSCGSYTEEDDGTIVIDADESNYLEGAAVVTLPACEEAVALELVAECLGEGDENMARKKIMTEQTDVQNQSTEVNAENNEDEKVTEVNASEQSGENTEVNAENNAENSEVKPEEVNASENSENSEDMHDDEDEKDPEQKDDECAETQNAEVQNAENQNAELLVDMTHEETDCVSTYDTDTGVCTHEVVNQRVSVSGPAASLTATEPAENASTAESSVTSEEQKPEEVNAEGDNGCKDPVTANEHVQNEENTLIAQILEKLEKLNSRIEKIEAVAESISQHEEETSENSENVNAEVSQDNDSNNEEHEEAHVTAEKKWTLVNPFMADLAVPKKKYSLLEERPERKSYSLL